MSRIDHVLSRIRQKCALRPVHAMRFVVTTCSIHFITSTSFEHRYRANVSQGSQTNEVVKADSHVAVNQYECDV